MLDNNNYEFYDIKTTELQKQKLKDFIIQSESNNDDVYWLLWINCSSFVQRALYEAWIVNEFNPDFWSNVPYIYNAYLNELSKWENNFIESNTSYSYNNYSLNEKEAIKNKISENYNVDRNLLDLIDNEYQKPIYQVIYEGILDNFNN